MAVVRKYKAGGYSESTTPTTPQSYEDFLTQKLKETSFTSKGEGLAREVADRWVRLQKSGDFDKVYSYNPVKQEYSFNVEGISDPTLASYDWSGSKDAIQRNIIGQVSGRPDRSNLGESNADIKKFNTLIANWTNEYNNLQKSQTGTPTSKLGVDRSIPKIWDYIVKEEYGGNSDLASQRWTEMKDPELRKNKVKEVIGKNIDNFLNVYSRTKDLDRFSEEELSKVNNLKLALASNDWEAIKKGADSLGWNVDQLVNVTPKTDSELELEKQKLTEDRIKLSLESGTPSQLAEQGFIKINDPNNPLSRFVQSNENVYEKDGKFYLIGLTDQGYQLSNRFFEDRQSPEYGGVLRSSQEGTEVLQNWEERDLNEVLIPMLQNIRSNIDPLIQTSSNEYMNIFGGNEQLFPLKDESGNQIFGTPIKDWSNKEKSEIATNKFGHIDPTQTVFREENGKWVQYSKGSDNQYYKTSEYDKSFNVINTVKSTEPTQLNLKLGSTKWDDEASFPYYRQDVSKRQLSEDFDASKLELPTDAQIKYIRGLYESSVNKNTSPQHTRDILTTYLQTVKKNDPAKYRQLLYQLPKNFTDFIYGRSDTLDVSGMEEYKFPNFFDKMQMLGEKIRFGYTLYPTSTHFPIRKKGGVIFKLQQGSNQSWNEYLAKYNIKTQPEPISTTEGKPYINPTKTRAIGSGPVATKNEALDKAIMVANVGSLAPGFIGMGSALGAAGLELARDLADDSKSGLQVAGNLALNVGLAGAAFFGAGFLRGVKSGSKIAKTVLKATDSVNDVRKVVNAADKSTDVAKLTKGAASQLDDITKSLNKIQNFEKKVSTTPLSLNDLAKKASVLAETKGKAAKEAKAILTDIGKVSAFTQGIAASKSSVIGMEGLSKVVRYGTTAAVVGNAVANLPEGLEAAGKIKDVIAGKEHVGNISTDDVNALVSVLFAGKIGGLSAKRAIAKRHGTIVTGKNPSKVDVTFENGKTVTLEGVDKPSMRFINKAGNRLNAQDKSKLLAEYNKNLPKKDQVKELPKITKVSGYQPEVVTGTRVRNEGEFDFNKNYWLQYKGTQWANRYKVGDQSTFTSKSSYGKLMDKLHGVNPISLSKTDSKSAPKHRITRNKKQTSKKEVLVPEVIIPKTNQLALPERSSVKLTLPERSTRRRIIPLRGSDISNSGQVIPLPERLKKGGSIPKLQNAWSTLNFNVPDYAKVATTYSPRPQKLLKDYIKTPTGYEVPNTQSSMLDPSIPKVSYIDNLLEYSKPIVTPKEIISKGITVPKLNRFASHTPVINTGSDVVKDSWFNKFKGLLKSDGKLNIDPVDALNALQAHTVRRGNISAAQDMKQAAVAKMVSTPLMSKPYIRSTSPNEMFASKAATNVLNQGKRLASASSNLALGTAAQLSASEKAGDIRLKGNLQDVQMREKLNELRSNLGLQIDQANTKIIAGNIGKFAEGEAAIHGINAGLTTANTKAMTDLIKSIGDNYKVKDMQKGRLAAVEAYNDPNFKKAINDYELVRTSDYENFYNQYLTAMKDPTVTKLPFEETDYGKSWKAKLDAATKALEPFKHKIETTQMIANMGLPYSSIRGLNL